jgi:CubicO group peptidase (beta-lactamase class C family)
MIHSTRRYLPLLPLILLMACLMLGACGESSSPLDDVAQPIAVATVSPATAVPLLQPEPADTVLPPLEPQEVEISPSEMFQSIPEVSTADPRPLPMIAYLDNLVASGQFMGSVLVADKGEILLNQGFGWADAVNARPNTPTTQLRIGSLSKQFTAAAIMRLVEQGLLKVEDPVAAFLPDYPGGQQITVQQLLTHTSGLPNYEQRPDLPQVVQSPIALDDLIASFATQPLLFPPGESYSYSSSGYVILSKIIEVVSGRSYADFVRTEVFEPAGMSRSGYDFLAPDLTEPAVGYQLTPQGAQPSIKTDSSWPSGAGALYSTAEDMYRWDRALNSDQVLSAASRAAMFTPWVSDIGDGASYGYGWEISTMARRPTIAHGGGIFGFASYMARFPEDDAVIIVLSNGIQMPPRRVAEELAGILFENGGP